MMLHDCSPRIQEALQEGLLWVWGEPGLQSVDLFQASHQANKLESALQDEITKGLLKQYN